MKTTIAKLIFHKIMDQIKVGSLEINYLSSGKKRHFGDPNAETRGIMNITDESLIYEVITQGEIALGMGFLSDKWASPSIYKILLVLMLNEENFRKYIRLFSCLDVKSRLLNKSYMKKMMNTVDNCREQIGATYDTGNDFYELMLGPTMLYTCAIWPHKDATLDEAQENKLRMITEKAKIEENHRVLDIGCGWGTLCNHIHTEKKADVTGISLSREQIKWCSEKYPDIDFQYCDYREIDGMYDRIVSVGMAEHVGRDYIDKYLQVVSDHLKPGGRFVLHTMIYHGNDIFMTDGSTKYLNFTSVLMPNADSPVPSSIVKSAMKTGKLRLLHSETFGIHYSRTAQEWMKNMEANKGEILKKYSIGLYKAHEYSWQMGAACMETGTSLIHMVFEKQPYGASLENAIL